MLESLINPKVAEKRPYEMFLLAIALGIISSWIALAIGNNNEIGHLIVAFISIGVAPLLVHMIWLEEDKDASLKGSFLTRHWSIIETYGLFFLGVVIATSIVYVILPHAIAEKVFMPQLNELKAIRTLATMTGKAYAPANFSLVLSNNLTVLGFAILFSFIFGAGAVYIISWNASIVGVLIGVMTEETAIQLKIPEIIAYLVAMPTSILRLLPHGIFEITGYIAGGLAGGIMSAALIRGHIRKRQVWLDVLAVTGLAVALIFIGALIETV